MTVGAAACASGVAVLCQYLFDGAAVEKFADTGIESLEGGLVHGSAADHEAHRVAGKAQRVRGHDVSEVLVADDGCADVLVLDDAFHFAVHEPADVGFGQGAVDELFRETVIVLVARDRLAVEVVLDDTDAQTAFHEPGEVAVGEFVHAVVMDEQQELLVPVGLREAREGLALGGAGGPGEQVNLTGLELLEQVAPAALLEGDVAIGIAGHGGDEVHVQAEDLATDSTITLRAFLDQLGMGRWFRDYYITPISGAIWSTPKEEIMDFPAQAMIRFFRNHHLLHHTGQHQWYTVKGGSIEYVTRLERAMRGRGVDIRLGRGVEAVKRTAIGAEVQMGGHWEAFDEVVFATHSDQTLAMLADPTPAEEAALSAVRYQPNHAVLHADASAMPKRRATWSSWNYTERPGFEGGPIDLTYWMNCLQPIPESDPLFVTLNSRAPINEALIYDEVDFAHPVYDLAALAAQSVIRDMNGDNATWFCGAWMKNGFHEDGYASAMDVVEGLRTRDRTVLAA